MLGGKMPRNMASTFAITVLFQFTGIGSSGASRAGLKSRQSNQERNYKGSPRRSQRTPRKKFDNLGALLIDPGGEDTS